VLGGKDFLGGGEAGRELSTMAQKFENVIHELGISGRRENLFALLSPLAFSAVGPAARGCSTLLAQSALSFAGFCNQKTGGPEDAFELLRPRTDSRAKLTLRRRWPT
jgi:hypothetical protein